MKPAPNPRVGEIWEVNFSPQVGHEQRGIRPGLVISANHFNDIPHSFRIVVPLTGTDRGIRSHVQVDPLQGGLTKVSFLLCEQVKALSVERFRDYRGEVTGETLRRVRQAVARYIDARLI